MPKPLPVWITVSSVQSLSRVRLFVTPWIEALQTSLSITNSRSSLKFTSIKSVMPSNHLILCRPLLLLPPIPPSIRVFSNESTLCMRWPKYWSFSFSNIPSEEIPGLISFRMDWLDLLAVQGTLKSLLQHHSLKASILQHSAFFTVQLSHPYMTTGKTIALTRQMMLWKGCTQYASKFLKLSSGPRTGKCPFSFQSQRKAMPKNAQTTTQLYSPHMLVKWCSKFSKWGFNSMWTVNFQMCKLDLKWEKNQRFNCQYLLDHQKAREFHSNIYVCFID